MNIVNKLWSSILIITLCFFLQACIESPEGEEDLVIPSEVESLSADQNVTWSAGMRVFLKNCEREPEDIALGIDSYSYIQEEISAELSFINALKKEQSFLLILLADGTPIEFNIESERYISYCFTCAEEMKLNLSFAPEFSISLGRLDFIVIYDDPSYLDQSLLTYTIWIRQPSGPNGLVETATLRRNKLPVVDSTEGIYLYVENTSDTGKQVVNATTINISKKDDLALLFVYKKSGFYRIICMVDGTPVVIESSGKEIEGVFWSAEANAPASIPVNVELPKGESYFCTISTPLTLSEIGTPCRKSVTTCVIRND